MRDKEDRVRFSGYDVAMFKIFVFCLAAAFSASAARCSSLQVGFMSPSLRRHRALDRDGDLRCRRRTRLRC
jgi:ABC-type branched-subunit amino acid transport system permease subunit